LRPADATAFGSQTSSIVRWRGTRIRGMMAGDPLITLSGEDNPDLIGLPGISSSLIAKLSHHTQLEHDMPEVPRILFIEDNEGHIELVRRAFAAATDRYAIRFAGSLQEALLLWPTFSPELVVSDFRLPDGTGLDLLKTIPESAPIPIIIMTSHGSEQVAVEAMKAGAHDYIVKSEGALATLPKLCGVVLREWAQKEQTRLAQQELNIWMEIFRNAEWGVAFNRADIPKLETINQAYARMHGYTLEELRGMPIETVYPPECHDRLREKFLLDQTHDHYSIESLHIRKDGSTFPALIDITVLRDLAGTPKYRIANVQDMTERKKTEAKIIQTNAELRCIEQELQRELQVQSSLADLFGPLLTPSLDSSKIAELICRKAIGLTASPLGYVALADSKAKAMVVYSVGDRGNGALLEPASLETTAHPCNERGEYPSLWGFPLAVREPFLTNRVADQPDICRFLAVPVTLGSELVGQIGVANSSADYGDGDGKTLLRLAEYLSLAIQKLRYEERIIAKEQRLHDIFETSNSGIFLLDKEWQILFANRRMNEMFGFESDSLLGMPYCNLVDEGELPRALTSIRRLAAGEPQVHAERLFRRKNGERFWGLITGNRMANTDNPREAFVCTITDITLQKQAEEERSKLHEQLVQAQKMEVVGRLAGGIAHDFNNIITGIIGYVTLAKMRPTDANTVTGYLDHVEELGNKAADLTRSLLAFSRKQPLNMQQLDVNKLLLGTDRIMSRIIRANIAWKTDISSQPLLILADDRQLEQVLLNLIANACDAMPTGGTLTIGTATCTISPDNQSRPAAVKPGSYALIAVTDSGIGIAADQLDRVFEPFFTTKEVGKGTGLGLAMVYGIIKDHGGYVEIASQPQAGTTVRIYLPILSRSAEDAAPPLTEELLRGNETILVGTDDHSVRSVIRYTLEEFGYTVIEAVDGDEAVHKYRTLQNSIDLVVLDAIMLNREGTTASNEIRAIAPHGRVIIMNGYTNAYLGDESSVTAACINKPVRPSELLHRVRESLNEHA
jgi:PAS domain S-box-containing protein